MSAYLSQWNVAEGLTRLTLLKVLPGREIEVGETIEAFYRHHMPDSQFRVYRLFGSYDLLIVQDGCDAQCSDFVRCGSIRHITGASEYTCYKWRRSGNKSQEVTFNLAKLNAPLIALNFLKINPRLTQESGLRPELDFAKYLLSRSSVVKGVQMLNTFGWVEAILLITDTHLDGLLRRAADHLPHLAYRNRDEYFAEKTLTIIGHTLDVCSSNKDRIEVPFCDSKNGKRYISAYFSVACKPKAMGKIEKAAQKHLGLRGKAGIRFGPTDLQFKVPLGRIVTVNNLRDKLDSFKRETAAHLVRTHTTFEYRRHHKWQKNPEMERLSTYVKLTESEASCLASLGPHGEAVATAIYRYSNLTQTDLVTDAYIDLLSSVQVLKSKALKETRGTAAEPGTPLAVRLSYLEQAINQRAQNVYLGLEESPFVTYPAGNSVQRVFKSLEAYACMVLGHFSKKWDGFVCLGSLSSRFMHYADILVIPADAIAVATDHWAIAHELMHILENISPEGFTFRNPDRVLLNGDVIREEIEPGTRIWTFLVEGTTDILDYTLCCPLALKQYLRVVWEYLQSQVIEGGHHKKCETYLFRSFAVICFEEFVSRDEIKDEFYMYKFKPLEKLLMEYIKYIERYANIGTHHSSTHEGRLYFESAIDRFLKLEFQYLTWMFKRVIATQEKCAAPQLSKARLSEIYSKLARGTILSQKDLVRPEAVAWYIRKMRPSNTNVPDIVTTSWLLSLWHLYQTKTMGAPLSKIVVTGG